MEWQSKKPSDLVLNRHFLLLVIITMTVLYRIKTLTGYIIPTFGNTMYHVGVIRETIETSYYPSYELSYGGGFEHFYVPAYRLLITSLSITSGVDPMVLSGITTIVIAVLIIIAIYSIGYRMGNQYVGLSAALLFILSPELTIFTTRALPELLGLFMLPLTLYFVSRDYRSLAILTAMVTALTHQMTLLALALTLFLYSLMRIRSKDKFLLGFLPLIAACVTYGAWQVYSMGTLNIFGIAQIQYREGTIVGLEIFSRMGIAVIIFLIPGLYTFFTDKVNADHRMLLAAWLIATFILTKNDLIFGLIGEKGIFMDRFFTFFVQCAVILGGFGLFYLLNGLDEQLLKEKSE